VRFDVFTLFPGMFVSPFGDSIVRRAIDAGLIGLRAHNIRDWAEGKHKITDDYAFGGGGGMVMKPDPIFAAVEAVLGLPAGTSDGSPVRPDGPVILLSAAGRPFDHRVARELADHPRVALICGHYEGVDERVREHLCDDEISIGDFVLTGGEIAAMVIIDAVARLVPGVLPEFAPLVESHAVPGVLEYPHYTRPASFRGWRVPDVLLSGDHARIARWRRAESQTRSRARGASIPRIW
jgi:tRNA (guanine37-N1)-methyltransferase